MPPSLVNETGAAKFLGQSLGSTARGEDRVVAIEHRTVYAVPIIVLGAGEASTTGGKINWDKKKNEMSSFFIHRNL